MHCCGISQKQDSIVENNRSDASITTTGSSHWPGTVKFTISNKPAKQAAFTVPNAVKLCVFLC